MQAFVSYARNDLDPLRAARVIEALSRAHIEVWTEADLAVGEKWVAAIDQAIRASDLFVILLTPGYLTSDWCEIELGMLLSERRDSGKPLLTIVMTQIDDAMIPRYLRQSQFVDGRGVDPARLTGIVSEALDAAKVAA
jgi:hypothetical protein